MLDMMFKQKKGNSSKCFRYRSEKTKIWDSPTAYNYYPVCYEVDCKKDPATGNWTIDVMIGDQTVTCENQLQEIGNIGTDEGDSIICPARFDVFC